MWGFNIDLLAVRCSLQSIGAPTLVGRAQSMYDDEIVLTYTFNHRTLISSSHCRGRNLGEYLNRRKNRVSMQVQATLWVNVNCGEICRAGDLDTAITLWVRLGGAAFLNDPQIDTCVMCFSIQTII